MKSPHIFARSTVADLPVAVGGEGAYLSDANGKLYLDACGGAAVSCLGHQPKAVVEAAKAQLDKLAYAHTSFFTSEPAEQLAAMLAQRAPDGLDRVYFVSGGSEAVETALKLAWQFHHETGAPERRNIIARRMSYHGTTLGALSASGNAWRREFFQDVLAPTFHHVDPCHYWRFARDGETIEDYAERTARSLEEKILELGPETVAAFIAEPVVGATMGAVPAAPGYFKRIREICDRYGVLLIADEIMCGMGRTGTLFACEQEGITPDMVTVAKGLGAGLQPIGATLVSHRIHETLAEGTGVLRHGHTYLGHPVACAAGIAVLQEIENRELLANVRTMGATFEAALRDRFEQHPNVGNIRGRGLFWGIELVEDRDEKRPFDPALKVNAKVKSEAMARGLMCYPAGGSADGKRGDHILLAPPFIVDEPLIGEIVDRLDGAVGSAIAAATH